MEKKYFYLICILFIGLIIFLKFNYNQQITKKEKLHSQNIDALQLEIVKYKNSVGDNVFEKTTLITTIENLKKINENLAKQVTNNKNEVKTITELKLQFEKQFNELNKEYESLTKICSGKVNPDDFLATIFDPKLEIFKLDWKLSGLDTTFKYYIEGSNAFNIIVDSTQVKDSFNIQLKNAYTFLKSLRIETTLYTGIQYNTKQKRYEIFATTPNNNIKFDLVGNIDEKMFLKDEDSFIIGPYVGLGFGIPFNNSTVQFPNLSIGFGLMYKFWSF